MSGPRFLVPSDVSDSIAERENCILFTQRLQYATFPLYSLELTTHSTCTDTQAYKDTHTRAQMNANAHKLSSRLRAFSLPLPEFFSSAVTFRPDMPLKSVTRSGGVISAALCTPNGHKGRREGRLAMMSWCWTMRVNSALRVT